MAGRPIKIDLVGDDSQLKKTLKGAGDRLGKFGTSVAKIGITAGAAFGATAVAIGTKGVMAFSQCVFSSICKKFVDFENREELRSRTGGR